MDKITNQKDIILFVDDEKICHTLLELIIPNFTNFKLIGAYNGNEAISLARRYSNNLCLILCDVMLPDIDGYEIYYRLSQDDKCKNIPFVFQSGVFNQKSTIMAKTGSAVKIIYKPYKQQELLKIIHETAETTETDKL